MSLNKEKLLLILNDAPFFLSHRLPLAIIAQEKGFDVHIATPYNKKSVKKIISYGFKHHSIPLLRGNTNIIKEIILFFTIFKLIYIEKPKVLHCVTMKPVLYGGIISRILRIPAVVHAITGLGYLFIYNKKFNIIKHFIYKFYKVALNHQNALTIFQNNEDLNSFISKKIIQEKKSLLIKGCGVNLNDYNLDPENNSKITVVFPARIIGDKGVYEFVEAAEIIKKIKPEITFAIVGQIDTQNPTSVSKETLQFWVDNSIIEYWGFSDNMSKTYEQSSIICLPSYREGLPRTLIEASASRRPIVTTDVPGCNEIVRDNINGFIVPVRNSKKLSEAILKLIDDKDLRIQFGKNGREIVKEEFTVEIFKEKSMHVYDLVLNNT